MKSFAPLRARVSPAAFLKRSPAAICGLLRAIH